MKIRTQLHELPLQRAGLQQLNEKAFFSVSNELGVAAVAREFHVDLFLLSPLQQYNREQERVRFPFLGRKAANEFENDTVIQGVLFLGCPFERVESGKELDLLAIVTSRSVYVFELRFCSWFYSEIGRSGTNLSSALKWRLRKVISISDTKIGTILQLEKVQLECSSQFRILILAESYFLSCVEYQYYQSTAKQLLEPTKDRIAYLYDQAVNCAALGKGIVLASCGKSRKLFYWIPQNLPNERESLYAITQSTTESQSGEELQVALSDVWGVGWIIPGRAFWTIHGDGSRKVFCAIHEVSGNSIKRCHVKLIAIYPPLSLDGQTNAFLAGTTEIPLSSTSLQVWSGGIFRKRNSEELRLYLARFGISKDSQDIECPSLNDLVQQGFLCLIGSNILGSYIFPIITRGKHPQSRPSMLHTYLQTHFEGSFDRNAICCFVLTEAGINVCVLVLSPTVPKPPQQNLSEKLDFKKADVKPQNKDNEGEPNPKEKQVANTQLGKSIQDLQTRIQSAELDLIDLRSEFVSFTSEVSRAMDKIIQALKVSNPET